MAIANEILCKQDKDGMLRRALERIIQLYTDKSHFIYELLQNAEDAGASKIQFIQKEDKLIVLHDGRPFSTQNLQGLCDIGKSDKADQLNQIGEFGVGFKSVFGICETVKLYSTPSKRDLKNGYKKFAIEIHDFTRPEDIEYKKVDDGYTTKFVFPYCTGLSFSGFDQVGKLNQALSRRLQNLGITTLLFMNHLQSIHYKIDLPALKTEGVYRLDNTYINDHCRLVSASGITDESQNISEKDGMPRNKAQKAEGKGKNKKDKDKEELSYLVFSRPVEGLQTGRSIDLAFAVSVDRDGNYTFKESKDPYISVYFPTEKESKLKFIVQGPFRTTPNRGSVPDDDPENIALAGQLAALLADSILELRDMGQLDFSLLQILPVNQDVFYSAPLFENMFDTVKSLMQEEKILPCRDGSFASANEVKIARGDKFADVLTDELLTKLIADGTEYHWLPTDLTENSPTYKELYSFLTYKLGVEMLRPENLRNLINSNTEFFKYRDDAWLVAFYKMYDKVPAAFNRNQSGDNMLTARFIKTSTGRFVAPYRKSDDQDRVKYLPEVYLPSQSSAELAGIHVLDASIYEQCAEFFENTLALKEPDEAAFFIKDFKDRIERKERASDEQNIQDIKKLLRFRKREDCKDEIEELIQKWMLIKCRRSEETVYENPNKIPVYFSVTNDGMSIELYYANIKNQFYVDLEFYEQEGIDNDDLKSLGVRDSITFGEDWIKGYLPDNRRKPPEWHTYGEFRWNLILEDLGDVLEYIEKHPEAPDAMAKSSLILRFLLQNEEKLTGRVHISGRVPDIDPAYSNIAKVFLEKEAYCRSDLEEMWRSHYRGSSNGFQDRKSQWTGRWLYTQDGRLVSHTDIPASRLNTELYGPVRKESSVYKLLGFKKESAESYDLLSDEEKDDYFQIELMRRYGLTIRDLDNSFGEGAVSPGTGTASGMPAFGSADSYGGFEFPDSRIKDWDALRKHTAQMLYFADPVKYEARVRKVRISHRGDDVKAYLKSMYRTDVMNTYACQMCHEPVNKIESCQIEKNPKLELDPMHLCLCPNCAEKYRSIRRSDRTLQRFLESILKLTEAEIEQAEPVQTDCDQESIWFTQTHIAEIRELMKLQDQTEHEPVKAEKISGDRNQPEQCTAPKSVAYTAYVGKRVFHKRRNEYALVKECDGTYIFLEFDQNPSRVYQYNFERCKDFLTIIE